MGDASEDEKLLEFLYACPVGLIECDASGGIRMMNPHAMQHIIPIAGDRDVGNLFAVFEQHAPELQNLAMAFSKSSGRICSDHRVVIDLGGGRRGAEPKVLACTLMKLGPDRLMATLSDISLQVAQERRLRQADVWFATLLDKINDYSVLSVSRHGHIQKADEAFTRQLRLDDATVLGRSLAMLLGHDRLDGSLDLNAQFELATRDGWHLQESWQKRADGDRYWCQRLVVARGERDGDPPASFLVVLRDVPRREAAADDLHRLLTRDHLTGAANRMHFSRTLEDERIRSERLGRPLSLVVFDLDHFKSVNDTHGHPIGDAVLRRVTETCHQLLLRRGLFARIGGEEFAVLIPDCHLEGAMDQAEILREAIAGLSLAVPGGWLTTTASFGCATLDEVGGSADALIELADRRLYDAKKAGRNRVHHGVPA